MLNSYFGFQDANLRIMFCVIFFEIVGWYWFFLCLEILVNYAITNYLPSGGLWIPQTSLGLRGHLITNLPQAMLLLISFIANAFNDDSKR